MTLKDIAVVLAMILAVWIIADENEMDFCRYPAEEQQRYCNSTADSL